MAEINKPVAYNDLMEEVMELVTVCERQIFQRLLRQGDGRSSNEFITIRTWNAALPGDKSLRCCSTT